MTKKPTRHRLLGLMSLVLMLGCANTAVVTSHKPPDVYVEGTGRVAVCAFSGPEDLAPLVRSTILERLKESGTYEIIDDSQVTGLEPPPTVGAEDELDLPRAIGWGRSVGADTILVGHVRAVQERGYNLGGKVMHIGDLEVKTVLTLELVDVHRGDRLYHDQCERSYLGEFEPGRRSSNSKPRVLARLVGQCAKQAADKICGRQDDIQVKLASDIMGAGASEIRRGVKLARQGNWAGARELWQKALAENPENSGAMYNLGVACEASHDYSRARQHYAAAYEIGEDESCRQAMLRVDRHQRELQTAMRAGPIPISETMLAMGVERIGVPSPPKSSEDGSPDR